jgi:hypothetical protein
MNLLLLVSLQAAASPAPPPAAISFDLARVRRTGRAAGVHDLFTCDRTGGDVVVCGHRPGPAYPLDDMAKIFEPRPIRAETDLGGGAKGGVYVQQVQFGAGGDNSSGHSGLTSNRILVGIKTPF